jgi:hypothetical protein
MPDGGLPSKARQTPLRGSRPITWMYEGGEAMDGGSRPITWMYEGGEAMDGGSRPFTGRGG